MIFNIKFEKTILFLFVMGAPLIGMEQKTVPWQEVWRCLGAEDEESTAKIRINDALRMYALSCLPTRTDSLVQVLSREAAEQEKTRIRGLPPLDQAMYLIARGDYKNAMSALQPVNPVPLAASSTQVDGPSMVRNLEQCIRQDGPGLAPGTLDVDQLLALLRVGSGEVPLRPLGRTYHELEKPIMANTADTTLVSSINDQLRILGLDLLTSERDRELKSRIAARQEAAGKKRPSESKAAEGAVRGGTIVTELAKVRGILDLYRDGGSDNAIEQLQRSRDFNKSLTDALSAFINGDLTQFDPQVGDDLCELRALLLTCLRTRCQDLPILRFLQRERIDLYALTIWACYLLTYIPKTYQRAGILGYQGPCGQLTGCRDGKIYIAFQRFLAALSVIFVRELMRSSTDEGLRTSADLVLSTENFCATMPFYCSIKAFLTGAKIAQCPVVSIFRCILNNRCKDGKYRADFKALYCMFLPVHDEAGRRTYRLVKDPNTITGMQNGPVIVYEWNSFPCSVHYERFIDTMNDCGLDDDRAYLGMIESMIQSYGIENLILMDAAQHDQFIKVPGATRECLKQKIEGSDDRDRDRKAASLVLAGICSFLGAEYDGQLTAAYRECMNEECKTGGQDKNEIKLIVDHVFLDTFQRYIPNLMASRIIK